MRNSSFCYKGPWNSIEHKIRRRIILTFTSSIKQPGKLAFYVHGLSNYARMRHRLKHIDRRFQKYNFQTLINSSFCKKGPRNSIEHKIRKRIILTFTFFRLDSWKNQLFTSTDKSCDARVRNRQIAY